jgi:hypothetical protein
VTDEPQEIREWDKRDNESPQAFAAFVAYRNLGPSRSVVKACKEVGKTRATLHPWSTQHDWVARAGAWDRYCDQQDQRRDEVERLEGRRLMHEDHAKAGKRMWRLAADALGVSADTSDEAAKEIVGKLPSSVHVKLLQVGMAAEVRARHNMVGRNLDPRDAERIADELIEVALRFVPEEQQAAFLSEIESFMLGA